MSETTPGRDGHLMLAATKLLRPGPTRVGSLGRITLPRTVRLRSLVSWVIGGTFGLLMGAVVAAVVGGITPLAIGVFVGAGLGHVVTNVEPQPGENVLSYLLLASTSQRNRVALNGTRTRIVLRSVCDDPPEGFSEARSPIEVARAGSVVAYAVPVTRQLQAGARAYIGICPLAEVAAGPVRIAGGMVAVAARPVDERGLRHRSGHPRPGPPRG
ncbi:MAG: hypothetical protein M3Y36_02980 [Actinomycetota bacterium]|nr:hypothetical protein [Actinomycetota bacterium]